MAKRKTNTTNPVEGDEKTNGKKGARMTIAGTPGEIREGLESLLSGEGQEPDKGTDPKFDKFMKELEDPENTLEVIRVRPATYPDGEDAKELVLEDHCPAELRDIKVNVFSEHGGYRYKVMIKDPRDKLVAAHMIQNPQTKEPVQPSVGIDDGTGESDGDEEPPNYYDEEIERLKKEEERLGKQQIIAERKKRLKEIGGGEDQRPEQTDSLVEAENRELREKVKKIEEREEQERRDKLILDRLDSMQKQIETQRSPMDPEIQALKESVAETKRQNDELKRQVESNKDDRLFSLLEKALISKKDDGGGLKELAESIKGQQDSLLAQEIKALRADNKGGGLDADMKRLQQLKEIVNPDGGNKGKESRVIDAAVDSLLDKALGGGDGSNTEDDPLKFAVKEMIPAVKDLIQNEVDKKRESKGGAQLSKEQSEAVYKQAVKDVMANLRQQGLVISKPGQPLPQPAAPQPGAPQTAPAQAAPAPVAEPQPAAQPEHIEAKRSGSQEGGQAVKPPPGPESPAYDRKKSLEFIVDTIISDIHSGVSDDTFVVGDAVDGLDDDFLDELCEEKESQGLYKLIKPYVAEDKIKFIEQRAEQDAFIKTWLNRVISSIQYDYQKQLREGPGEEDAPAEGGLMEPSEAPVPEQDDRPTGFTGG